MRVDTIIGIDPGKTGGIAIKFRNQYKVHKMPDSLLKIDEMLKFYKGIGSVLVILEQIRLHFTSDIAKVNRMQKMFAQYEQLKTLLVMNDIPFIEVGPTKWQSYLGLRTKRIRKMDRTERKRAYRDAIQSWWPEKLNIDVADSVCLMVYGIRNLKFNPDFINELPTSAKERLF